MNMLTSLALSNNKKNKTRSILIIISIFLTTLSLMIIASWGYGIIKTNRINAGKLYGSFDGVFKNVTESQLYEIKLHNEFTSLGTVASLGVVENEASLNLFYMDDTALKLRNMLDMLLEGTFPNKENELAGQKAFFASLGYKSAKVGDKISLSLRTDNKSKYRKAEFVISGLIRDTELSDLANSYVAYVSEEFYNKLITRDLRRYNVFFQLQPSIPINLNNAENVLQDLAEKCGIDKKMLSVNNGYIIWARDPGTETIFACGMIAALVIFFSVVVIYNIFQVDISYKIQEYGKIKAVGATKKQLKRLIFTEGMMLAAVGIPLGIIAGYMISTISFNRIMNISNNLSSSQLELVSLFNVPVILLVLVTSLITVCLAVNKPMRIVSGIVVVEALRYHEGANITKGVRSQSVNSDIRKGKQALDLKGMTFANLLWNKRRTISTILTMGLSCVLFVTVANLAGNIDEEYEARRDIEYGQFCISLKYSLNDEAYPENNLDNILKDNPLSPKLIEKIRAIKGVTEVKTRNILAVKVKSDNQSNATNQNVKQMSVLVLNREDFNKIKNRGSALGDMDYDTAVERKAILFGWSHFLNDYGYELNQMLDLELISGNNSVFITCPLIGSFGSIKTDWAITEDTFNELGIKDNVTGTIWVDCEKKNITEVRNQLQVLLSDVPFIEISEYQDAYKTAQFGTGIMKLGIYSFLTIIGVIGFLNMANTIITSIITRKKEYGVLQAIGMTNRQLNLMLQSEGLFFTIGTILMALIIGMPAGLLLFNYAREQGLYGLNIYKIPLLELAIMIAVIALMQAILSFLLSRNVRKESLVERIRYYE